MHTPTKQIKHLLHKIRDKDVVVVPTDKTNSFRVVHTQQYVKWMENQLDKVATRTTKKKLGEVYDDATWLLVEHKDSLSANEFNYILEMINSHAVPTPKLLIKDHRKPLKNGDPSVRLVVPGRNLCAGFPNVGYGAWSITEQQDPDMARSHTGFLVTLNNLPLICSSKL